MIPEHIIKQYQQYCSETNFTPFSKSAMQRILSWCTASVRKSLQGLDYFSVEGVKAFDDLVSLIEKLVVDAQLERQEDKRLQQTLKEGKSYLKNDCKVFKKSKLE